MHIHVQHPDGEAKVWLEPGVQVALDHGLSDRQMATALRMIREHEDEIRAAWQNHFPS